MNRDKPISSGLNAPNRRKTYVRCATIQSDENYKNEIGNEHAVFRSDLKEMAFIKPESQSRCHATVFAVNNCKVSTHCKLDDNCLSANISNSSECAGFNKRPPRFKDVNFKNHVVFAQSLDATTNEECHIRLHEHRGSNLVLHHHTTRRGSFLYRQDSGSALSHHSSRHESITGDDLCRYSKFGPVQPIVEDESSNNNELSSSSKPSPTETLEELEWCLERLENIQTHRSVSDMASCKFKKMLNKELSQFADRGQGGKQISEYICSTFLDSKETDALNYNVAAASSSNDNATVDSPLTPTAAKRNSVSNSPDVSNDSILNNQHQHHYHHRNSKGDHVFDKQHFLATNVICEKSCIVSSTYTESSLGLPSALHSMRIDPLKCSVELSNSNYTKFSSSPSQGFSTCLLPTTLSASSSVVNPNYTDGDASLAGANVTSLLPKEVTSTQPEQLETLIQNSIDHWGMDIFMIAELTPNPLTCVFYGILKKRNLMQRFNIPEQNVIAYMKVVEDNYTENPYHNRMHAADVVQSTHVLLNVQSLDTVFTDLEILAILFACAIHDVNHPGVTNQYLINTNDQLALLYNDASVLENHHLAVAFTLLNKSGCDMFENFSRKQRLNLRRMIIDMVLATDMSKHMSLLADLKTMVETKKVAGSGILTLENYTDRMQILQNMVHCADLSNPTKPLHLYRQWTNRIMEEHFRQGDREYELGLDISPICDRNAATIEKSQVSFIDYIVHPLWETWSDLVYPDAQTILESLENNREWYLNQMDDQPKENEHVTIQEKDQ